MSQNYLVTSYDLYGSDSESILNPPAHKDMYGVGGVWVQFLEGQGDCACAILVLLECISNALTVLLVLAAFDDTGSLGSLPHQVVYPLVQWFHLG